ncbi:MAG TPA: hypothetical protein VG917_02110 [Patescibacteria group bacterium]|nr:hypothetical protein [Patescibacteria group bacterium]
MTKKIVYIAILIILVVSPSKVLAEGDYMTTSSTTEVSPSAIQKSVPPVRPILKTALGVRPSVNPDQLQAFKNAIAGIQDARKKAIVTRISNNITTMNTNLTNIMTQSLARMTTAINALKTKSAGFKSQGKNTANLDSAISKAETAITTANTAVAAQALKTYSTTITDTNLKNPIAQMVSTFRQDITTTHQTVVAARTATIAAFTEASKLGGENTTATSSGGIQ